MRIAVIDLGTNTFHLLIAEISKDKTFKELFRHRQFIKLAEDGIEKIGVAPFERGINALQFFCEKLKEYEITTVKAIGTAALRTASNGAEFIKTAYEKSGIRIELISGDREAELIHKGVELALPVSSKNRLIMDIGGGSVEFIIADDKGIHWAQSFPIGVAVLFKQFHQNNPISQAEIDATISFLSAKLSPLVAAIQKYPVHSLVGASGTFDVLENILVAEKPHPAYATIDKAAFFPLYQQFLQTTVEERLAMEGVPASRADMIIVALILIDYVLKLDQIPQIEVSAYAMKEGMIKELIENNF